ncbi:VOC family protein [Dongia deserti]|uniref:VOC family protein n=1 Tax=Dongia deserti TaxID=2268030 RepID=UPI000E64E3B8|nr:VOC family protein [Dongia deserti]
MEQRLSLVTLGVRDLAVSRAFYTRLGWKESAPSNDSVAFFQCGGVIFGLWSRDSLVEDAGIKAPGSGFSNVTIAHNVRRKEEVDTTLQEAEQAGATILKPASETFWGGYTGYFADPDGFAWEVAWNPGFTILDDGSIKLPGQG